MLDSWHRDFETKFSETAPCSAGSAQSPSLERDVAQLAPEARRPCCCLPENVPGQHPESRAMDHPSAWNSCDAVQAPGFRAFQRVTTNPLWPDNSMIVEAAKLLREVVDFSRGLGGTRRIQPGRPR
jgi:hypothetical protein